MARIRRQNTFEAEGVGGPIYVQDIIGLQKSAFGELSTAESTSVVQLNFNYNINTEMVETAINGGSASASVVSNMLALSTGAAISNSAQMNSRIAIKYGAGQGNRIRASGLFTQGVAGSSQILGGGDAGDGLFFGYKDDVFGILRRYGGLPEVRIFAVTTASTTAESVTVTLDGETILVPVTNSGNTSTTANELGAADYSNVGGGWRVHVDGSEVEFFSFGSGAKAGTFSLTASTAVATVTRPIAGVAADDSDFIPQTEWNLDKADGESVLPVIDWTKGNVFQIQYQWLGFGGIEFFVENPETKKYIPVHILKYPNSAVTPSLANPHLQLCAEVVNTTNNTDIVLNVGSIGGFVEGTTNGSHFHNGLDATVTLPIGAAKPVLSIHNKLIYNGKINKIRVKLIFYSAATDGNKSVAFRYVRNATLTDASFTEVEPNSSVIEFDVAATAISGGDEQFALQLEKIGSTNINVSTMSYYLNPQETLTVVGESASTNEVTVGITWEELF